MQTSPDCIFCKIVAGDIPSHKIWESDTHLAFLSIFPNTEGFSVVIPKAHYSSYVFAQDDEVMIELMRAAKTVAQRIDAAFPDVGRTGLMCEGFGVNHLHAKLFPMHGTAGETWEPHVSDNKKFFTTYEGYMSSHDSERADDTVLAMVAEKIRAV